MEVNKRTRTVLPNEVWSHILSYVNDLDDLIDLKLVNRIFYQELKPRDPFAIIDSRIKISKDLLAFFHKRNAAYSLPREYLKIALEHKPSTVNIGKDSSLCFKTIVVGRMGVGKTTFAHSFAKGSYNPHAATVSAMFLVKKFVDSDGISSTFEVWDTAGEERYRQNLAPVYVKNARAILCCFSIDERDSFVALINKFIPDLLNCVNYLPDHPVIYLLGLKSDLEGARQVSIYEAKALARALKIKYFECSTKSWLNVAETMNCLKDDLLRAIRLPAELIPQKSSSRCSVQ
jgi:small GTP-binding protein